jgi:hypothetical protein
LAAPAIGPCAFPTIHTAINGENLMPGVYCGGIALAANATVTFAAGNYIVSGGGIAFQDGTTSSGSGVMFYLTGTNATYGSVTVSGNANVTFSAPASGPQQGVLFFQDRSITSANDASFQGSGTTALTGSLYFPTTNISFQGGSFGTSYATGLIAQTVTISGDTYIKGDPTGAITGLGTRSASLMQ